MTESVHLQRWNDNGGFEFVFETFVIQKDTAVTFEFDHVCNFQNKAKVFMDYFEVEQL